MFQTLLSSFIVLVTVFSISALGQGANPGKGSDESCAGPLYGRKDVFRTTEFREPFVDVTKEALVRGQKVQQTAPEFILTGQNHPAGIALDDKNIYWISNARSSIDRVSKSGGTPTRVVTNQTNIRRLVLKGDRIYFNTDEEVKSVSTSGGTPQTLATITDIAYLGLAVDNTNVYYVSTLSKKNQLMKVSTGGGAAVSLTSDLVIPSDIGADGTNAYWVDYVDNSVKRVSVTGGKPETIGECPQPNAVAVDADRVYCAGEHGIVEFKRSDNSVVSRVENSDDFSRIAFDEKNLYLVGVKGLYRVSKAGGRPVLLVELQRDSTNLAVDATSIYWTNYFGGTLMRLRK